MSNEVTPGAWLDIGASAGAPEGAGAGGGGGLAATSISAGAADIFRGFLGASNSYDGRVVTRSNYRLPGAKRLFVTRRGA